ncbi:Factor of DNA methylation 3 [Sesamum angolense]|uniref:Factor of DNA methylation 3 n=1 Tax=Sesamum angolense TaxID=2727404 RepID=A0AAE1WYM0_9LAMI|nr:Factor of DNA methylation 3 [Sesamum angolense]
MFRAQSCEGSIGVKMVDLDSNVFIKAAKWKNLKDQVHVKDDTRHKPILDEEDQKLKNLRKELGKDAYEAMGTALMEGDAYSPRGMYPVLELCNYKEQRRATLKEAISYLIKQWSMLKKKEALDADAREGEGLKEEEASDADAGEGEELKKEEPLAADAGEGKERGTKKGY